MKDTRQEKNYTIIFAGGGSGGHVLPVRRMISYIDKHDKFSTKVKHMVRIGAKGSYEQKVAQELQQECNTVPLDFAGITSGKIRREYSLSALWKNIVDVLFRFPWGVVKSLLYIWTFRGDVVFCKGGHAALPVVFAAKISRTPIVVHESDTSPGRTNRIAARRSYKTFTGFDGVLPNSHTVGQILSPELIVTHKQIEVLKTKNDDFSVILGDLIKQKAEGKKIVFVSGGSQGSRVLYSTLFKENESSQELQAGYVFVTVLGLLNAEHFSKYKFPSNVITLRYCSQKQMGALMSLADIAALRGGTTTLAECKLYDLPLIIVPLPITHDQKRNALYYQKEYGDIVLDQNASSFAGDLTKAIISCRSHTPTSPNLIQVNSAKQQITQALLCFATKEKTIKK